MLGLSPSDSQLLVAILTFLTALIGVGMGIWNKLDIKAVHETVNSRMSELLARTQESSEAAGAAKEAINQATQSNGKRHLAVVVEKAIKTAKITGAVKQIPKGTKIK